MTLLKHELRQSRLSLTIWTGAIGLFLAVCVFLYPEMKGQMGSISDAFASMGSFSEAFGMDKVNFGSLTGFYAIECGNILGLGGAFFASLCAISALSKEEREHTAEFLLTHPVSRRYIVVQKLLAVLCQIVVLNLTVYGLAILSVLLIGEPLPLRELTLLHFAYFLLQLALTGICFGISALLRRGSFGIGIGVATALYFLNLMANITDRMEFLKYITPFAYADGAGIVETCTLESGKILLGMAIGTACAVIGSVHYCKKDIT